MPEPRVEPISKRGFVILGALCVVGIAARSIGLGGGLWFDEMVALVRAYREPMLSQFTVFQGDFHHTLYSVLARSSLVVFGDTAWAIRLPALLFGAATIPVTYLLGRELMGERDGWLAAGFLTVFYPHVWFSQNARGYTMLAFWSTLATLLLVRQLRGPSRRPGWAYAIVVALGVYTHLTMVFLAVGHAAVCLVESVRARWERPRVVGAGLTFVIAAALTLALYGPMLTQVLDFFVHRPSQLIGVSTPLWALFEAIRVIREGLGVGTLVGALGAAVLFGLGVLSYAHRAPLVLALFLAPGVVTVAGATVARGTMYPRFFFFMVAFLVLLLVRGTLVCGDWIGARFLRDRPARLYVGPAIVGVMVLGSLFGLVRLNYRYPKQDYESAIAFVESRVQDGDTIVTTGDGAWPLTDFHGRDYPVIESVDEIEALRASGGRLWMVFTFPLYIEAEAPDIMQAIDDGCADEAVFPGTIGGGDLYVCSFPPTSKDG